MFYGSDTKFSYSACLWIKAETVKIGKHIHHKMCEHGRERGGKVWVSDHKGEKTHACFLLDAYKPETSTVYQFHKCNWHGILV